ncbi:MAG: efflux RND transporter permease subunit [Parvularculales bacterium]
MISFFVRHHNAANLLMGLLIVMGLYSITQLNIQFFPTVDVPVITVSVGWSGAGAEDVESNIVEVIEPEIRFVDGMKRLTSVSREGIASMSLEFEPGTDMQNALSSVELALENIPPLPLGASTPVVSRILFYETVASLAISGPFDESALRSYAKQIRDELLATGVDKVSFEGLRAEEIWVEVPPAELQRLNLTLQDIAGRIGAVSQDLPSGTLEGQVERRLRSLGRVDTERTIGTTEIRALDSGEKVILRDIAIIRRNFNNQQPTSHQGDKPAIRLNIQRAESSDILQTAARVDRWLENSLPQLPASLEVTKFDVSADLAVQRINLLLTNGLQGLALVLVTLFLFLNIRAAIWVSVGIPVAAIFSFFVMYVTGQSINMISLFAIILTIGILVDDAIVVGEHAVTLRGQGYDSTGAAERAAYRMLPPVAAAVITTIVAFAPIFLIGDALGQIISAMPQVVIAILVASMIECFLILPGHLKHGLSHMSPPRPWRQKFNKTFDNICDWFADQLVRRCYEWRYTVLAVSLSALVITISLLSVGRVKFEFFPSPESEVVNASLIMTPGTPRAQTQTALEIAEAALHRAGAKLLGENGKKGDLITVVFGTVGIGEGKKGDNFGKIFVELIPGEFRTIRTATLTKEWQKEIPPIAGLERFTVRERSLGPPGRDIDILLQNAPPHTLKQAANDLREILLSFPGVSNIEDSLPYGKQEVIIEVTPRGTALGFTTESIGRQLRNAYQGTVAKRFVRGDEEVAIRVQFPRQTDATRNLRTLYLRASDGSDVPLTEVVSLRESTGFSRINRIDGLRTVSVAGEIDSSVISSGILVAKLAQQILPDLARRHGVDYTFSGRAEEQAEAFSDLQIGSFLALAMIYIILAWVFSSYIRPIVVMSIIPFGLVGAILGHLVMGFSVTILSLISLLGLSGILINDSIILVSQVDLRIIEGLSKKEAVVQGVKDRFRAVTLTSFTTIVGLLPLLFETSLQAQFLLPMVITIAGGLTIATGLVLILVPALFGIQDDIGAKLSIWHQQLSGWFRRIVAPSAP